MHNVYDAAEKAAAAEGTNSTDNAPDSFVLRISGIIAGGLELLRARGGGEGEGTPVGRTALRS